jgi:hypothetical protein
MAYIREKTEELTGYQERRPLKPSIDLMCDFVMVYGTDETMPEIYSEHRAAFEAAASYLCSKDLNTDITAIPTIDERFGIPVEDSNAYAAFNDAIIELFHTEIASVRCENGTVIFGDAVELADRAVTVFQGRINAEFRKEEINQDALTSASFGIVKKGGLAG